MALIDLSEVVADRKLPTRSMTPEDLRNEAIEAFERAMTAFEAQDFKAAAAAMTTGWNITGTLRRRFANGSAGEDVFDAAGAGDVIIIDGEPTFTKGGPTNIYRIIQVLKEKNTVVADTKNVGIRAARKEVEAAVAKELDIETNSDLHVVFAKGM